MVTAVNSRDIALAGTSPRIVPIALPTNLTIDFTGVTGTTRPANNATSNTIYKQTTMPTISIDGDIWVDTGTQPNTIRTKVAGSWVAAATYVTTTGNIVDSAGLGTTATWTGVTGTGKPEDYATVNRVTRSTMAPISPVPINGDIWIDTSTTPNIIKMRIGGNWTSSASLVTDTAQIPDGAQLGHTALWPGVTGTGRPADYADVTTTILGASGTSIVMTNSNLFKSASGVAGVFIGSGGIVGKNSAGAVTFAVDGATGNANFAGSLSGATGTFTGSLVAASGTFAGALSAATGTFTGSLSAATGTFSGSMSASGIIGGTMTAASINIAASGGGASLFRADSGGTTVSYYKMSGSNLSASNAADGSASPLIGSSISSAAGVYGVCNGIGGHGLRGEAGTALGFVGYGGSPAYDFYAAGSAANYGPFTGSHDALVIKSDTRAYRLGLIVADVGVVARKNISNTLCEIALSDRPNQPSVGVVCIEPYDITSSGCPGLLICRSPIVDDFGDIKESVTIQREFGWVPYDYRGLVINAVGEGQVLVCGEGGDFSVGDLITTSSTHGLGMRQSDGIQRSCTVAKIREAVHFSSPGEERLVACIYLCG